MTTRIRLIVALASLVFFAIHLRSLPQTLEDIDSINFALGVEKFDVSAHRPHPPGYPVFIALAKASTSALGAIAPSWDRDHRAAAGLAFWGLVAGTLATYVFTEFWIAVGLTPTVALLASLVSVACPIFWLTAARPLTDTPGVVAAIAVQTGFVRGLRALRAGELAPSKIWIWPALGAGFIIGLRSQTLMLTGPLLCWCAGELIARRRWRDVGWLVGASAVGALLWAVPLLWFSGGLSAYLSALRGQGAGDFDGAIEMLASTPSWRLFGLTVSRSFLSAWQNPALAKVILGLALVGIVRLAISGPRVLAMILLAFWPYLVFHITFQETITFRYNLPLVVPVAALATICLAKLSSRLVAAGAVVLVLASVVIAQPTLVAYAEGGAPVFRAFQDMHKALPASGPLPVLRMHHQVYWGVRRVIEWYRPIWDVGPVVHPGDREWLGVVTHFAQGDTRPVFFLGDLSRNDLLQFDPRARNNLGVRYELAADIRQLVGGVRLDSLKWWVINRPGWMLGHGWSITPEVNGMTTADRWAPHQRPAEALLLRQPGPAHIMIGGRYLAGRTTAEIAVDLDGQRLTSWQVAGNEGSFVHWIDVPAGVPAGPDAYARLAVRVSSVEPSSPPPVIALEQFDAAPDTEPMFAFDAGWNESEDTNPPGHPFRWASGKSTLVVRNAGRDLTLVLSGESPLKNFPRAPTVVVKAGDRELGRFSPATDFTERIRIPAAALDASSGRVTIETDLTFAPAEKVKGSLDTRRLGLVIFGVRIER